MSIGTLTSKGQITIPHDVRDRLQLKAGDRIEFRIEADNSITLVPMSARATDVFGSLSRYAPKKAISTREMHRLLAQSFRRGKSVEGR